MTGRKKIDDRLRPAFDAVYEAARVGGHFVALGKLMDLGFAQDFKTADQLATDGEAVATNAKPGVYPVAVHGLLRRVARFYDRANDAVAKNRCLLAAAEHTLAMRHEVQKDSGAEAHWVDQAIREMVDIPGTEERRATMEVELRALQRKSLSNMGSFSVDLECKEDQQRVTDIFETLGLSDGLIQFAHLTSSPDPEMLRNEATQQRADAPLAAMLSAAYIDERGRTTKVAAQAAAGMERLNLCIWDKTAGGMGSFYRSRHELVFLFRKPGAGHLNRVELGKHGRNRANVWTYEGVNGFGAKKAKAREMHPTVKPMALVRDALLDSTERGDVVLDLFSGSGTTLIAAEQSHRRGRATELDPRYVDVGVLRWQDYTGLEARLASTGRTFREVREARRLEMAGVVPFASPAGVVEPRVRTRSRPATPAALAA